MDDKNDRLGYVIAGIIGAAAGAAAMLGLSGQIPKMMKKCCREMKGKCGCGGSEPVKASGKKQKKG